MLMSFQSIEQLTSRGWYGHSFSELNAVHLWGIDLDASPRCLEQCVQWLDKEEQQRAARLIREEDRQRYILAHGGLRVVLGRYLGIAPEDIELSRSEAGKPFITRKLQRDFSIAFNMSHAHGRALIAVSQGQEVGVDLERIRLDMEVAKLSDRYFTPSEHATIMQLPSSQRAAGFFRYWVAKEAVLKAQGIGIRALSQCEILMGADGIHAAVVASAGSPIEPNWGVRLLSCNEGWEAAVAARGTNWAVQHGPAGS